MSNLAVVAAVLGALLIVSGVALCYRHHSDGGAHRTPGRAKRDPYDVPLIDDDEGHVTVFDVLAGVAVALIALAVFSVAGSSSAHHAPRVIVTPSLTHAPIPTQGVDHCRNVNDPGRMYSWPSCTPRPTPELAPTP